MNKKHVGLAHPGSRKRKYIYLIILVGLVCSIVGYFNVSRCILTSPYVEGVKTHDTSKKYSMILHIKPSNKRFII